MPTRDELRARNVQVIAAFRANDGTVDMLPFPIVLLTTTGRTTGALHTTPLGYTVAEEAVIVVASSAGSPTDPDWFKNLSAQPAVSVELGANAYAATAVVRTGTERDRLYAAAAAANPIYAEYASTTARTFPVMELVGVPAPQRADSRR